MELGEHVCGIRIIGTDDDIDNHQASFQYVNLGRLRDKSVNFIYKF